MGIITTWAANRGLNLSETLIKNLLDFQSFEKIVTEKLDVINQKLDVLIEAPFKQAQMYLREGSVERCKEKLIEAISLDELNLPAYLLYTTILFESGKDILAIEYLEQIINKFGPHKEFFSEKLIEVYNEYLTQDKPLQKIRPFAISQQGSKSQLKEVYCSLSSLITFWEGHGLSPHGSLWSTTRNPSSIAIYDWTGKNIEIFRIGSPEFKIFSITEEYLVIQYLEGNFSAKKVYKVFRVKDGTQVQLPYSMTEEKILKLFISDPNTIKKVYSISASSTTNLTFAGVNIKISGYDFSAPYNEKYIQVNPL